MENRFNIFPPSSWAFSISLYSRFFVVFWGYFLECLIFFLIDNWVAKVFHKRLFSEFWLGVRTGFPTPSEMALSRLLPVWALYWCQAEFQHQWLWNSKYRSIFHNLASEGHNSFSSWQWCIGKFWSRIAKVVTESLVKFTGTSSPLL